MIVRQFFRRHVVANLALCVGFCGIVLAAQNVWAQAGFNQFGIGVVGGVSIDADGVVRVATQQDRAGVLKELREHVVQPTGKIAASTEMRMISLAKLQAEIEKANASGEVLSDEVRFLPVCSESNTCLFYPERNDIVLAGPPKVGECARMRAL